jgi:hypothetical protein
MAAPATTVSTPAELAEYVRAHPSALVGVVTDAAEIAPLFDSLAEQLAATDWRIVRVPENVSADDVVARLAATFAVISAPAPRPGGTLADWRERLFAGLRNEQLAAQARLVTAKQQGAEPAPIDRDVAGWLAAGLIDLLGDPITGAAFVKSGTGVIARIAAGDVDVQFAEADFVRPEGIKFLEAARPAQMMLTKLSLASTNQFRAAAARLMNRVLDSLLVPVHAVSEALQAEESVVLIENPAALGDGSSFISLPARCRLVVAALDEAAIPLALRDRVLLVSYAEVLVRPVATRPIESELDSALRAFQIERQRAEVFMQRDMLRAKDLPDNLESVLASGDAGIISECSADLRARLAAVWRQWFVTQLADLDAEGLLAHTKISSDDEFTEAVLAHFGDDNARLPLPLIDADIAVAEQVIADLQQRQNFGQTESRASAEEVIAFDEAVAAGGAPLEMLTDAVKDWLREEKRDLTRYRIVRID